MAITINWNTFIINIPKADTSLIQTTPAEIRELNINTLRLALKDIEDNEDGLLFPNTHNHNTEVSLGGLVYARIIEIIDPYTITFEDGPYAVNLVGANSNIGDRVNFNQVSIRTNNAAGLISAPTSGVSAQEIREEMDANSTRLSKIHALTGLIPATL